MEFGAKQLEQEWCSRGAENGLLSHSKWLCNPKVNELVGKLVSCFAGSWCEDFTSQDKVGYYENFSAQDIDEGGWQVYVPVAKPIEDKFLGSFRNPRGLGMFCRSPTGTQARLS
ncbi:hypothetical protein L3X38_031228 [Prunus dulcis]|uniref:Uncharacterized protein n=1 Tax=Prunus dulcis TaxID=3755 RepID=A0AAD4VDY2_PRUDU|nr:hypothetical protein L3X38_031228 [Prunus dulcis]